MNESRVGGACGPPPPFAAPLVPRCALTSGATPRDALSRADVLAAALVRGVRLSLWERPRAGEGCAVAVRFDPDLAGLRR
jgi:hypothetical protein